MRCVVVFEFMKRDEMVPVTNAREDVHERQKALEYEPHRVQNQRGVVRLAIVAFLERPLEKERNNRVGKQNTAQNCRDEHEIWATTPKTKPAAKNNGTDKRNGKPRNNGLILEQGVDSAG